MPIITKSSPIAKDAPITFTLDKAALAALPIVVASAWYGDTANWKKVIINYKSTSDNEMLTVLFDATQVSPTGTLLVISPSKDVFEAISMTIVDFNNGSFRVPSTSLDQADFVVNFDSAAPLYTRDFADPNGAQSYEQLYGSCAYVDGGISMYRSPSGDGYYFNRANVVTFIEGQSYTVRVYVKESSGDGPGAYGANIYIGEEGFSGSVASFSDLQINAAVGSYLEATFVANATNASGKSITWAGGCAIGSFVISKIEVFGPSAAPSLAFSASLKSSDITLSNGNLTATRTSTSGGYCSALIDNAFMLSGSQKIYLELTVDRMSSSGLEAIGIDFQTGTPSVFNDGSVTIPSYYGFQGPRIVWQGTNLYKQPDGMGVTGIGYIGSMLTGQVIGIAVDIQAQTFSFNNNGTWSSIFSFSDMVGVADRIYFAVGPYIFTTGSEDSFTKNTTSLNTPIGYTLI